MLCPVRPLRIYVHRSGQWDPLSFWYALLVAKEVMRSPSSVCRIGFQMLFSDALLWSTWNGFGSKSQAHSNRGVASFKALARGSHLYDVCAAAGWSSPHIHQVLWIQPQDPEYFRADPSPVRTQQASVPLHSLVGRLCYQLTQKHSHSVNTMMQRLVPLSGNQVTYVKEMFYKDKKQSLRGWIHMWKYEISWFLDVLAYFHACFALF